jgi:hypothetical protein
MTNTLTRPNKPFKWLTKRALTEDRALAFFTLSQTITLFKAKKGGGL